MTRGVADKPDLVLHSYAPPEVHFVGRCIICNQPVYSADENNRRNLCDEDECHAEYRRQGYAVVKRGEKIQKFSRK